jgi:hypothetical protein
MQSRVATASSEPRKRGQPKRPPLKSLRSALAFNALKLESGRTWTALECTYIQETAPHRLPSPRKPHAFLRYAKGKRVPKGPNYRSSPVRWAIEASPAFERAYNSPLFELLMLDRDLEKLIEFTRSLYESKRIDDVLIDRTIGKAVAASRLRYAAPLWNSPKLVLPLRHLATPDALCLILVALMACSGRPNERQCLMICAEWLQHWCKTLVPHEHLKTLMLQVLTDHVPQLAEFFSSTPDWNTLLVDLSDPCFAPDPLVELRDGLRQIARGKYG